MIKYILKKNNVEGSHSFGKWYAFPVKESTVDIDKLAEHMAAHNTPYSAGAIKGSSPTWCRVSRSCSSKDAA